MIYKTRRTIAHFNSRPSARGDKPLFTPPSHGFHFNSRPSARGDQSTTRRIFSTHAFQFTPLREGRRRCPMIQAMVVAYFNSRPSARGDFIAFLLSSRNPRISIHAPPRGATGGCTRNHLFQGISIHAPPRGATFGNIRVFVEEGDFNSRPSARGDCDD